jgi:hypothetical protein
VIGGGVCVKHGGGAPQVRAAREARILSGMAALEGKHTPRDPGEALMAATADADAILQRLKAGIGAGGVSPSTLVDTIGQWIDRVGRLAKVVVDARIDMRKVELEAEQVQIMRVAVARAIAAAQLDAATRAVFLRVLASELRTQVSPPELES